MTAAVQARGAGTQRPDLLAPELWCVDLIDAGAALQAIEHRTPRLSAADRLRAATFSDPRARGEWQATHIALRLLIERVAGPQWRGSDLVRSELGKPHLAAAPLAFSLSHAPGLAMIGIAPRGSIGVDVERARAVRVGQERRARIEEAGAALGDRALPLEADARFLQAWVRLEAYAKADGCGIGRLLTRLGILGTSATALAGKASTRAAVERMLSDAEPPCRVVDRDLGDDIFAAVAFTGIDAPGALAWLPTSFEGLQRLLA